MSLLSSYVTMLLVSAPGDERVIKQESDYGIINHLIGVRSMLVPLTPRLGAFVDPRKSISYTGILYTPMATQPTRLSVHGKFVVVAYEKGHPDSLNSFDIAKFHKLYRAISHGCEIKEVSATPEA